MHADIFCCTLNIQVFHCKNTGGNIPPLLVDLMNVSSPAQIMSGLLLVHGKDKMNATKYT